MLKQLGIFLLTGICNGQLIGGVGGERDTNDCLIGAGYTWCESSQNCIRRWETPCEDNYYDCNDCLKRQRKGENIACPSECDIDPIVLPPIAIDPMPPVAIDPIINNPTPCSEVMCMMYCEYGNVLDSNGCPMCECNDSLPPPLTDIDCRLDQPSCDDYTYVCPKITEVTNCNTGGIDGYTTFRLSVVIKDNMNVKNIYAIYGNKKDNMHLPPAYQSDTTTNSNIGGIDDFLISLNPSNNYDSWLTIGITDGDKDNLLSEVGIDFNEWTDTNAIDINNGGVFVMDPEIDMVDGNEYIIGQITVRTGSEYMMVINIQGKTIDNRIDSIWSEKNVRYLLSTPQINLQDNIPNNCVTWHDGCNTCRVNNGVIGACTRMMCFREDNPRCIQYSSNGH